MREWLLVGLMMIPSSLFAQTCPIQDETSNLGGMTYFVAGADPFCVIDSWNTSQPVTETITVHGSQGPGFSGGTYKSSIDQPTGLVDANGAPASWSCTASTPYGCWKWQTHLQLGVMTNQIQIQGHDCGGRACSIKGYGYVYVTVQQVGGSQ